MDGTEAPELEAQPVDLAKGAAAGGESAGRGEVAGPAAEKKPKVYRTTRFDRVPGRRPMREYPLTATEIWTLGAVQGASALFFAFSGSMFGFWINIKQTTGMAASDTDKAAMAYWSGLGDAAFWGSVVLATIALALFGISGFTAWRIMKETDHGDR